jgi:hypothetical protein
MRQLILQQMGKLSQVSLAIMSILVKIVVLIPRTSGTFQEATTLSGFASFSGTYYLRIKTKDNSGMCQQIRPKLFIYKVDNAGPREP